MTRLQANLVLLAAALLWGAGNVAQKTILEDLGPLLAVGLRSLIGLVVIAPLLNLEAQGSEPLSPSQWRQLAVISTTFLLAIGTQQVAYGGTSVTNASFLVNTTVVFTPLFGLLLIGERPGRLAWPAMVLALGGAGLMAGKLDGIRWGDACCLASATLYSVWIVLVAEFMRKGDRPITLVLSQFGMTALFGTVFGLAVENVSWAALSNSAPELLVLGILSTGLAFTLQAVAQRATPPADAAIVMSGESVFGALAGAAVLGERMTLTAGAGAVLIIVAVIVIQLPFLAKGSSIARLSGRLAEALRQTRARARRRRRLWAAQRRPKAGPSSGVTPSWAGRQTIPVPAIDWAPHRSWIDEVSRNE
jgi:drug/metabolite transporter (DMT)-like permease